jgi:hypothetical protein
MNRIIQAIAIRTIPVVYVLLTYNVWWAAPAGTLLIVLLARVAWPGKARQVLGLAIPVKALAAALLLACAILAGSFWLTGAIAAGAGVRYVPLYANTRGLTLLVHTLGQILNEEVVLGALLLRFMQSRLKTAHPAVLSVVAALAFALLHAAFYGLQPTRAPNYGYLAAATLVALFAAGVARNNCILCTRHIGYALALHAGWNIAFMDGLFFTPGSGLELAEPAMFNLVLWDPRMVAVTAVLMAASFGLYAQGNPRRKPQVSS